MIKPDEASIPITYRIIKFVKSMIIIYLRRDN